MNNIFWIWLEMYSIKLELDISAIFGSDIWSKLIKSNETSYANLSENGPTAF